jgi:hypothetical protein
VASGKIGGEAPSLGIQSSLEYINSFHRRSWRLILSSPPRGVKPVFSVENSLLCITMYSWTRRLAGRLTGERTAQGGLLQEVCGLGEGFAEIRHTRKVFSAAAFGRQEEP